MQKIVEYLSAVALGRERGVLAACLGPLLLALSILYGFIVWVIRLLYRVGILHSFRAPIPVISVGNITAGGTGKTPFVVMLYRLLREQGFNPMVLTRGYMAGQGGRSDEAVMLNEIVGPRVFVGADRKKAFVQSYVKGMFDCVVLDDGFQQWGFARDLDIVLIDSETPFGNGSLIPRGVLREPLSSLRRAGILVWTRVDRVAEPVLSEWKTKVKAFAPSAIVGHGVHHFSGARDMDNAETVPLSDIAGPAGALCAIGSPDNFRKTLERIGVEVKIFAAFPDHYRFTQEDARRIVRECSEKEVRIIYITHKDAGKVRDIRDVFVGIKIVIIDIEFILTYGKTDIISSLCRLRCS